LRKPVWEQALQRIGILIFMVLAIALGLLVGTLNNELVEVDLLWFQLNWPLGLLILAALAMGLLVGVCAVWLFRVLPLRMKLRKLQRTGQNNSGFPDITDV
jgi:uncharacterized integral membrane protein